MNNKTIEEQWDLLARRYSRTRCPLSADEMHRCINTAMKGSPTHRGSHVRWRYAVAATILLAVVGTSAVLLWSDNNTAQHTQVASRTSEGYSYTKSETGVRVYCESGCSADDVLRQMRAAIQTLD